MPLEPATTIQTKIIPVKTDNWTSDHITDNIETENLLVELIETVKLKIWKLCFSLSPTSLLIDTSTELNSGRKTGHVNYDDAISTKICFLLYEEFSTYL